MFSYNILTLISCKNFFYNMREFVSTYLILGENDELGDDDVDAVADTRVPVQLRHLQVRGNTLVLSSITLN